LAADAERCRQLREKREAVRSELPNAEADHESQRGLWEQWQQQWQAAIGTFSGDRTASPVAINQQLKKIDAILDTRRDRDRDLQTLQELERAAALFVQRVRAIADAVAEPDEFASADQLACRLHERLLQSKQVQRERQRLHKERTQAIEECDESRRTLDQATVQLQQLCVEARVQTPDELPAVEERAAEKRRLRQAVSTAEDRLTELAAGESLENFNERVERWDPVELEAEIEQSEKRLQASEEQQQHFQQQLGALKTKLEAIDGGDRAAELNQQIQFLTGRIERETAQYARLKVASMILRRSIEHYRRANETPVLRLACEAFEALTCGRYSGLRPDFDDKGHSKLFGVERGRGGEELVPVELMSAGTQDAVFFALRLASLRHQLSSGRTIPVVIDDCLIQLDDRRAEAALREFGKLAETTQVILFTHHRHLLELAASALDPQRYQLHRLSAPVSAAER
jgi:uncharacterized protein YhaN